jgi:hypothetical protein
MKLVGLVAVPPDPSKAVDLLVAKAGFAPAEARMRLAGEPPAVLARLADPEADALCATLRAAGLAALACQLPVPGDDDRLVPRSFELGAEEVTFHPRTGPPVSIAYASITLLLRGLSVTSEHKVRTETQRKFSLGKAMLTQGLSMTKTVKHEVHSQVENAEHFLLIHAPGLNVAIREDEVVFTGLGKELQPSRVANMNLVSTRLRERCANARYDDRLLRMGKRGVPLDDGDPMDVFAEFLRRGAEEGLLGSQTRPGY